MTLLWLEPEAPKVAGIKPHVQRSACLRYALHLSWLDGRRRFIAWHTGLNVDHERVGEFARAAAARAACEAHLANLERQAQLRRSHCAAA